MIILFFFLIIIIKQNYIISFTLAIVLNLKNKVNLVFIQIIGKNLFINIYFNNNSVLLFNFLLIANFLIIYSIINWLHPVLYLYLC